MRNILYSMLIACALPVISPAQGTVYPALSVGSDAPDFSLPFATKDSVGFGEITLSAYAGEKTVILAFYPADWSGGCTREVCAFRDNFTALGELDVELLPISGDYPYSHYEWAKAHNLPFLLLSDSRHRVAPLYHSYNESSGYNKRTVYVVDKLGKIAYIDMEYSTRDLKSFEQLRKALNLINADEQ
ncbi:MAG TPA: peroxiredoxin [Bacteroidota bacterium]|nr:peroxiredoxin [Bacteroidota bacterium]